MKRLLYKKGKTFYDSLYSDLRNNLSINLGNNLRINLDNNLINNLGNRNKIK